MESMGFKAITLDFGGTLAEGEIDWGEYHEAIQSLLRGLGLNLPLRRVKSSISAALERLRRVREANRELTLEEVYAHALKRMGIPPKEELLEDIHNLFRSYFKSQLYPCAEEVVRKLSRRYRLAVISNTISDTPRYVLRRAHLDNYFDVILCSRDLGIRKPDPRLFRYVLERLGVEPEAAVHVGDDLEADVEGALRAGMTAIWVRGPTPEGWSGLSIGSICELPELLERLERYGDP
jgi:putative hydrolase of the HAD superfamily